MFSKKCPKCNTKVKKSESFCPFCGTGLRNPRREREDYGLIGLNDHEEMVPEMPFDSLLNVLLKNAMKMVESQMKEIQKAPQPIQPSPPFGDNVKVQFYVNGKKVFSTDSPEKISEVRPLKVHKKMDSERLLKFSQLPKKEPKSKVRRFSEKLVYELAVPGVKNLDDVLINQLESSLEIKAISKDKVYFKTLNVDLPLLSYNLSKGVLTLELQTK